MKTYILLSVQPHFKLFDLVLWYPTYPNHVWLSNSKDEDICLFCEIYRATSSHRKSTNIQWIKPSYISLILIIFNTFCSFICCHKNNKNDIKLPQQNHQVMAYSYSLGNRKLSYNHKIFTSPTNELSKRGQINLILHP